MARSWGVHSLATQLAAASMAATLLFGLCLVAVVGTVGRGAIREQLRGELAAVAAAAAAQLDADVEQSLRTAADESRPEYRAEEGKLQRLRAAVPGLLRAYALRPHPDPRQWSLIVEAAGEGERRGHVGQRYDASRRPDLIRGRLAPAADHTLAREEAEFRLSGYAPVKNGEGRVVAVVVLDMSAAAILRAERAVLRPIAIAMLVCLLGALLLASLFLRLVSAPVAVLAQGTTRIAQGRLDVEVPVKGPRELRALGASFNIMAAALREQRQQLIELTNTDFLTALPNHRYFQERFEQEIARAGRYDRALSLLMLDLDYFRVVNTRHGHKGGDCLLRQVASLLRATLRDSDIITRYGGEEFAAILPEADAQSAYEAAERVREAVAATAFAVDSLRGHETIRATVSGGVAAFPEDSRSQEGLLVAADVALLRAKYMSRNRICLYGDQPEYVSYHLDPAQLHRALQDASISAVESLAHALDARDHYTRGHSDSVTRIALAIAQVMELPADEQAKIRVAGLLHDVGKIGIPDRVLNKSGALSLEEWGLVRAHPDVGAQILAKAPLLGELVAIVRSHHERFDGGGYPGEARGDQIPLAARIIAVADAYDAMTSDRPYRPAMSQEQAVAELQANAGSQFDPAVVAVVKHALARVGSDRGSQSEAAASP